MQKQKIIVPLLAAQQEMLAISCSDSKQKPYFQQLLFSVSNEISKDSIKIACQKLENIYDVLHTRILFEGLKQAVFVISDDFSPEWREILTDDYEEILNQDLEESFDFQKNTCLRWTFIQGKNQQFLLISYHHILMDGWGRQSILKDFIHLIENPEAQISQKSIQKFYEEWKKLPFRPALNAWNDYVSDAQAGKFFHSSSVENIQFSDNLILEFKQVFYKPQHWTTILQQEDLTESDLFHISFVLFLSYWLDTEDINIGTVVQNGILQNPETFGLGIQLLPWIGKIDLKNSVLENIRSLALKQKLVKPWPFVIPQDIEYQLNKPDIQLIIAFENYPISAAENPYFKLIYNRDITQFPLSLAVIPIANQFEMLWHYSQKYFSKTHILLLAESFQHFINQCFTDLSRSIFSHQHLKISKQDYQIFPKKSLLECWNQGIKKTIIVHENQYYVAEENIKKYQGFAHWIKENLKPNEQILIISDKHPDFPFLAAACWFNGHCVIPVNNSETDEYIEELISNFNVQTIFVEEKNRTFSVPQLTWSEQIWNHPKQDIPFEAIENQDIPALAISTSGTTGKPKTILINLFQLQQFFDSWTEWMEFSDDEYFASIAHPAFDIGFVEMILPIFRGWTVEQVHIQKFISAENTNHQIEKWTAFHAVPNILEALLLKCQKNDNFHAKVMTGGDKVSPTLWKRVKDKWPAARLFQFYGPSECTVLSTAFENIGQYSTDFQPIGKAFRHVSLRILSENGKECSVFETGEIVIGGSAISLGYFNENQNVNKFVNHEYFSGDLGFKDEKGNIFFEGRKDNQIKINGRRLEINRIIQVLSEKSGLPKWEVFINEQQILTAVCEAEHIDFQDLEFSIRTFLPDFAIPSEWFALPVFPLNKNGKTDLKKIKDILAHKTNNQLINTSIQPSWEKLIEKIFSQKPDWNKSFRSNGAHSIDALRLIGLIKKEYQKNISFEQVLHAKNLIEIFEQLTDYQDHYEIITEKLVVSQAAQRILFLSETDPEIEQAYWIHIQYFTTYSYAFLAEQWDNFLKLNPWLNYTFQKNQEDQWIWSLKKVETKIETKNCNFYFRTTGPLILKYDESILYISVHHAFLDGIGLQLLLKSFIEFLEKEHKTLKFVQTKPQNLLQDIQFWKQQIESCERFSFPFQKNELLLEGAKGFSISNQLPQQTVQQIKKQCLDLNISVFEFYLTVWAKLLRSFEPEKVIYTGIPVTVLSEIVEDQITNMSVNCIPFKIPKQAHAENIVKSWRTHFKHRHLDLSEILKCSPVIEADGQTLFQSTFLYQSTEKLKNKDFKPIFVERAFSMFDLSFEIIEHEEDTWIQAEYRTEKFSKKAIQIIIEQYKNQIEKLLNPVIQEEVKVSENIYPDLFQRFYSLQNVHNQFISDETRSLSLEEFYLMVQGYGKYLENYKNKSLVLHLSRSIESAALQMACMLSGVFYIPVDQDVPELRLLQIQEQALADFILKTDEIPCKPEPYQFSALDKNRALYGIATSGTTGKPKITGVSADAFASALMAWEDLYQLEKEKILLLASWSFDVSIGDLGRSVWLGNSLVIAGNLQRKNPEWILQEAKNQKISFIETTPVFARFWLNEPKVSEYFETLKTLVVGSDSWYIHEYQRLQSKLPISTKLISSYGLSETCIDNTWFCMEIDFEYEASQMVPLGKTLANSTCKILDPNTLEEVVPGKKGLLWIAGPCVGLGYFQNEWKKNHLVQNGFLTDDMAWIDEFGQIQFGGRRDSQVKIRSNRLNLKEIENILSQLTAQAHWCCLAIETEFGTELAACLESDKLPDIEWIKSEISKNYPLYYIPTYWKNFKKFPISSNNKIDRTSLTQYFKNQQHQYFNSTDISQELLSFAQEFFQKEIQKSDTFFGIGGDSISALRFCQAWNQLNDRKLKIQYLFSGDSFEVISKFLKSSNTTVSTFDSKIPISQEQSELWTLAVRMGFSKFNLPHLFILAKSISKEFWKEKIEQTLLHFSGLFVRFEEDTNVFQVPYKPQIQWIEEKNERKEEELWQAEMHEELDIWNGQTFRLKWIEQPDQNLIIFTVHHLVFDGGSDRYILEALQKILNDEAVVSDSINLVPSAHLVNPEFWESYFSKFNIPQAIQQTSDSNFAKIHELKFSSEKTQEIKQVLKNNHCSSAVLYSSALQRVMAECSFQTDFISLGVDLRGLMSETATVGLHMRVLPLAAIGSWNQVKNHFQSCLEHALERIQYPQNQDPMLWHQITLLIQHADSNIDYPGFQLYKPEYQWPRSPLTVYVWQYPDEISIQWEADPAFFTHEQVQQMMVLFEKLLLVQPIEYQEHQSQVPITKTDHHVALGSELEQLWTQFAGHSNYFFDQANSVQAIIFVKKLKEFNIHLNLELFFKNPYKSTIYTLSTAEDSNDYIQFIEKKNADELLILFPPVLGLGIIFHSLETKENQSLIICSYPEKMDSIEQLATYLFEKSAQFWSTFTKIKILGYSMGGIVGFEFAKNLESWGVIPELIILDKTAQAQLHSGKTKFSGNKQYLHELIAKIALDEEMKKQLLANLENNLNLIEKYEQKGKLQAKLKVGYCSENAENEWIYAWQDFGNCTFFEIHSTHDEIPEIWNELKLFE